jgi:hypothetical protein
MSELVTKADLAFWTSSPLTVRLRSRMVAAVAVVQ